MLPTLLLEAQKLATLREMTSAEFTGQIMKLDEPVRVKRYKDVLGDWYPGGHECPSTVPQSVEALQERVVTAEAEVARLKRELVKRDEARVPGVVSQAPTLDADLAVREAHRLAEQERARAEVEARSAQLLAWQRRMVTPQKGRGGE
jgi:hypothetical protein